jgi:hypothetical protein
VRPRQGEPRGHLGSWGAKGGHAPYTVPCHEGSKSRRPTGLPAYRFYFGVCKDPGECITE